MGWAYEDDAGLSFGGSGPVDLGCGAGGKELGAPDVAASCAVDGAVYRTLAEPYVYYSSRLAGGG